MPVSKDTDKICFYDPGLPGLCFFNGFGLGFSSVQDSGVIRGFGYFVLADTKMQSG